MFVLCNCTFLVALCTSTVYKANYFYMIQVTVWGDYGRMEGKKVFMGAAQIMLDDLDLSNIVIGWYKLFGTSSLVSLPAVQKKNSGGSMESGM